MVSEEPFPPYSPPVLADHFLTGRQQPLYWKGPDVAQRLGIDERRGTVVDAVLETIEWMQLRTVAIDDLGDFGHALPPTCVPARTVRAARC